MNKGLTLIELLSVLTIIIIICWVVLIIIGRVDMECYHTTQGIICTYDKIGSDKE